MIICVCLFCCYSGIQTNVSDSFSWTEFLKSAGKVVPVWLPTFIRLFYLVISSFVHSMIALLVLHHSDVCINLPYMSRNCQLTVVNYHF